MPEIEIRSANPNDFEDLTAFEHGYYSEYVWQMSLDVSAEKSQVEFRRRHLPRRVFVSYPRKRTAIFNDFDSAEAFLIAELNERPVGYLKIEAQKDSDIARVSDLVISAPMRRQGIASGLLYAAMDLMTHRCFHTLVLEMQSKNDPAIKMATKLGFTFCGFRDHFFPNQELALFYSRFTR
ncbi:MAG: GNAT family N-acetyltransferase [Chloroflexota bacterium]|nr:GNAT family N-acetyltransferase [Chloroflexota bacterium]